MSKPTDEEKEYTAQLWLEYKRKPTPRLRAVIAEKYTPLVHKVASGFKYKKPAVLDYDDLVQAGRMGLLDAIEKFDPNNERKAQFQTYATFRVRGAILDEINSMDWTPRSVRKEIKDVIRTIEKHYDDTQEEPTVNDIASRAQIDRDAARTVLSQMDKTFIVQIDNDIMDIVGPTTDHDKAELENVVSLAMDRVLDTYEKAYIVFKYFYGYNNVEVQKRLGLKASELKIVRENAIAKLFIELKEDHE